MDKIDKEYQYYRQNREVLLQKYKNKFIVIKGQNVVGVYDSEISAYEDAVKKYELGTFLLQQCLEEVKEQKAVFHTRVVFA